MRPWLGHVGTFLLGLTLSVTFYEGRRLVETTADALSATTTLDEPEKPADRKERRTERRGATATRRAPPPPPVDATDAAAAPREKAKVGKGKRRGGRRGKVPPRMRDPALRADPRYRERPPMREVPVGGAPAEEEPPPEEELPLEETDLPP